MESSIGLEKVSHRFYAGNQPIPILKNITLSVLQGEFIALLGKSGSGKSTLLNLIAGFIKPEEGQITILNTEITSLSEKKITVFRQGRIGFVFQSYHLISTMTALENVVYPLVLKGETPVKRKKKAMETLELVGLGNRIHHFPNELSGGEQQRISIGRALVTKPNIILADEPTGNLDSETEKDILQLIKKMNQDQRITVMLVTHDQEVAGYADRIFYLHDGKLQQKNVV